MGYTSMSQFHTEWSHFSRQMVTIDYDGVSTKIDDNLNDWAWYLGHAQRNVSWWYSLTLLEKCWLMLLLWDCLKILMDSFTIFWLSRTDCFRVPQMWGQFQIFLDKYSPLLGSVQWSEIPKWIGSSNIDFITHLQYDKLWGLPRRVFTLFQKWGNWPILPRWL